MIATRTSISIGSRGTQDQKNVFRLRGEPNLLFECEKRNALGIDRFNDSTEILHIFSIFFGPFDSSLIYSKRKMSTKSFSG